MKSLLKTVQDYYHRLIIKLKDLIFVKDVI